MSVICTRQDLQEDELKNLRRTIQLAIQEATDHDVNTTVMGYSNDSKQYGVSFDGFIPSVLVHHHDLKNMLHVVQQRQNMLSKLGPVPFIAIVMVVSADSPCGDVQGFCEMLQTGGHYNIVPVLVALLQTGSWGRKTPLHPVILIQEPDVYVVLPKCQYRSDFLRSLIKLLPCRMHNQEFGTYSDNVDSTLRENVNDVASTMKVMKLDLAHGSLTDVDVSDGGVGDLAHGVEEHEQEPHVEQTLT
jgi:hypothetical protein